jgi:cobalt-zinc-cadmium efflux system outer membrane protein
MSGRYLEIADCRLSVADFNRKSKIENHKFLLLGLILLLAGCKVQSPYDRSYVSAGIRERTPYQLGQVAKPGQFSLPEGISLDDGLSEAEAVAIALWNNAQLQADLTALGFARADLIEAHMLPNPVFSLLFPVGPKLLEMDLQWPIDVLWQRPHRIAAAKLDAKGLAENLVADGLGLIRDVQTTYWQLWSARQRLRLAEQDDQLQAQIAEIARGRLNAGDISASEAQGVFLDSLKTTDALRRSTNEAKLLEQQLNSLLGAASENLTLDLAGGEGTPKSVGPEEELLKTAFAARPDLRAAELAIEAAGKRLGWERSKVYNLIAVIDAKDEGSHTLWVGPGLSAEIPVLNQNNGSIARAKAELEQATRQYEAVRQEIVLQVQQARSRYASARETFDLWTGEIIPSLQQKVEQTQKSCEAGDVLRTSVLEARRELVQAKMHQTELAANLRRSAAELNYCIGRSES